MTVEIIIEYSRCETSLSVLYNIYALEPKNKPLLFRKLYSHNPKLETLTHFIFSILYKKWKIGVSPNQSQASQQFSTGRWNGCKEPSDLHQILTWRFWNEKDARQLGCVDNTVRQKWKEPTFYSGIPLVFQPPYRPDLSLRDFLFLKIKNQ